MNDMIRQIRLRYHLGKVISLVGKKYPEKAFELMDFLTETFPCRTHGIENCPECSSKIAQAQMKIFTEHEKKLDKIVEKHFKEFMKE